MADYSYKPPVKKPFLTDADLEKFYLQTIVSQNMDKNFVQRIANPDQALPLTEDLSVGGTHMMSSGRNAQGGTVYPEIIQRGSGYPLEQLSRPDAQQYAGQNGQFIQFPDEASALWFSQNYKKLWGK